MIDSPSSSLEKDGYRHNEVEKENTIHYNSAEKGINDEVNLHSNISGKLVELLESRHIALTDS